MWTVTVIMMKKAIMVMTMDNMSMREERVSDSCRKEMNE